MRLAKSSRGEITKATTSAYAEEKKQQKRSRLRRKSTAKLAKSPQRQTSRWIGRRPRKKKRVCPDDRGAVLASSLHQAGLARLRHLDNLVIAQEAETQPQHGVVEAAEEHRGARAPVAQHVAIEDAQEPHLTNGELHLAGVHFEHTQIGAVERALILGAVAGDA